MCVASTCKRRRRQMRHDRRYKSKAGKALQVQGRAITAGKAKAKG